MKTIVRFAIISAISVLSIGCCCNRHNQFSTIKGQFLRDFSDLGDYSLCVIGFCSDIPNNTNNCQDTMTCLTSVGLVYEYLKDSTITEEQFRRQVANNSINNRLTKIPSSAYAKLEKDKIVYDDELSALYSEIGIAGVLELLSTEQIYNWDKNDNDRFKYLASLCWIHGIFFEWSINCEAPVIKWFIYGNDKLLEKYYHPVVPEEWHELFPKQN